MQRHAQCAAAFDKLSRIESFVAVSVIRRSEPGSWRSIISRPISRSARPVAVKVERNLAKTSPLELGGPTFTAIWLADALDHALNRRLPQLQNTDGDPIVMRTSIFSLLSGKMSAECRSALSHIANLIQDSAKLYRWVREAAAGIKPKPLKQSQTAIALTSMNERGDALLGSLEIKKSAIMLSTNSRQRAILGEGLIMAALRGLVREPVRKEITAEEMLAEKVKSRSIRPRKLPSDVPPNQARAIVHAHLDRHYRQTLDEPIPALGGLTPQQAARSKSDRAKVVDWLKTMENSTANAGNGDDPMASYDFGWKWHELGLAKSKV